MTINYPELTGKESYIKPADEIRHKWLEEFAAKYDEMMQIPEAAADTEGAKAMRESIEALAARTDAEFWLFNKYIKRELEKEYLSRCKEV